MSLHPDFVTCEGGGSVSSVACERVEAVDPAIEPYTPEHYEHQPFYPEDGADFSGAVDETTPVVDEGMPAVHVLSGLLDPSGGGGDEGGSAFEGMAESDNPDLNTKNGILPSPGATLVVPV